MDLTTNQLIDLYSQEKRERKRGKNVKRGRKKEKEGERRIKKKKSEKE